MAHELFKGVPRLHGPLHGGLLGRSPEDPAQRPLTMLDVDTAIVRGHLTLPEAVPSGINFISKGWVTQAMLDDDQGSLGSCVSFATKHMREFLSIRAGHPLQEHSPLWIYYQMRERFEPDKKDQDTGAYASWAGAILEGRGFALEADWPYDVNRLAVAPPPKSYGPALWYRNVVFVTLPFDVNALKAILAADKAFMFGFAVFNSFYQAQGNGSVPMPQAGDQLLGGHEIFCIGYSDDPAFAGGGYFLMVNQWANFSPNNLLKIPYAYITGTGPDGNPLSLDNLCVTLAPAQ